MRARCALGWLSHGEHGHGASADSSGGGRSRRPSSGEVVDTRIITYQRCSNYVLECISLEVVDTRLIMYMYQRCINDVLSLRLVIHVSTLYKRCIIVARELGRCCMYQRCINHALSCRG